MESFGAILQRYRRRANLTQENLAERAGLSVQTISSLERGVRRLPRASTIDLLAEAMRLEPAQRETLLAAAREPPLPAAWESREGTYVTPRLLPRTIGDFTGRATQVRRLLDLLERERDAPAVVVVSGLPGVGKSTLAVHSAHLLRDRFPDGQLFVDLRGAEGDGVPPGDVLAGFLRHLGMDASVIPERLDERVGLFRARLVDRAVLVVLDNAGDEAAVRPLLPAGARCGVLVTSRSSLAGLEASDRLALDVMNRLEALELLANVAGAKRVAAEPAAADEVVRLAGHLPLAVRIAGARLAARPRWRLGTSAARLRDERHRLDELRVGDLEVRASLWLSYRDLDTGAQRSFRLLGLLTMPSFPAWLVAGLLGLDVREAEHVLERLVDASLVESDGEDGAGQVRYHLHSLTRLFAREMLAQDGAAERRAALERALGAQLALSEVALPAVSPSGAAHRATGGAPRWRPSDPALVRAIRRHPLAWYEAERVALETGVGLASDAGMPELAWELATSLSAFFGTRGYWQEWRATHERAIEAVRLAGDRRGEMQLSRDLGDAHTWVGDTARAEVWLRRALALADEMGDEYRAALCRSSLAYTAIWTGRTVTARRGFEDALAFFRRIGERHAEAIALTGLGQVMRLERRLDDAARLLTAACAMFAEVGDRFWEAVAQLALSHILGAAGRPADSACCLRRTISLSEELGNRHFAAIGRYRLAALELEPPAPAEAIARMRRCVLELRALGLPEEAGALRHLARLRAAAGPAAAAPEPDC